MSARSFRSSGNRKRVRQALRKAFALFPRAIRFSVYRSFVDCDPNPDARLVLKIAETQDELEACFRLLHDAYVDSGFMQPQPSGLRATIYHALPTTTTLCALFDGEVVGTISLIRQSSFGFPMQSVFDLAHIHAERGRIAEISALAVHPKFRKTGGSILFPLMKFMYQYCTSYFDTTHVVIAVNPNRIEMYESLLFFQRLKSHVVQYYDFANGAPAIGAYLNLRSALQTFKKVYAGKPRRKDLYSYFVKSRLPNIVWPTRRYFTTNDPVMTPAMLDYFFNQRTQVFRDLSGREKAQLAAIYNLPQYQPVLPTVPWPEVMVIEVGPHQRYSVKCHGQLAVALDGTPQTVDLQLVELYEEGFQAYAKTRVPLQVWAEVYIQLGSSETSALRVMATRREAQGDLFAYSFTLAEPDLAWRKFAAVLQAGAVGKDLDNASVFLLDQYSADRVPTIPHGLSALDDPDSDISG